MKHLLNTGLGLLCGLLLLLSFGAAAFADDTAAPAAQAEVTAAPQAADAGELMQLQLGSSSYALSVPSAYRNGEVTIEEVQANQVAYFFSPNSKMDFDIYQFPRPHPELSLEEYTEKNRR